MLLRLFLFQLLFLSLPDLYIYRTLIRKITRNKLYRILYWVPMVFFTLSIFSFFFGKNQNLIYDYPTESGIFILFLFIIGISKLLYATVSFIGSCCHRKWHLHRRPFRIAGGVLALAYTCLMLYGWIYGKERFEVKPVTITSERIPASFSGYRIVQLSDFHAGGWYKHPKAVRRLVAMTNELQPDLIVFTGDLVNAHSKEMEGLSDILAQLRAKDGIYAILGNHDYGDYYRWPSETAKEQDFQKLLGIAEDMGWTMLNNEHVFLHKGADSLALIGVENQGDPRFAEHGDLKKAMRDINKNDYKILLSHNPLHWRQEVLNQTDIDLILAGHTHGMQLSFFGFSPAVWIYPEWEGLHTQGKQQLYVNVGCGHIMYPLRIGAWPEITLFTLQPNNTPDKSR